MLGGAYVALLTAAWIIFVVVPLGRSILSSSPPSDASAAPLAVAALLLLAYLQWLAVRCFMTAE